MRRAAKIDDNQKTLVQHLRRCGFSVAVTSALGKGFPDIVVGSSGRNYLFEIKDPAKCPARRRLTEDEAEFKTKWRGQYDVIETIDDALRIIDKTRL